MLTVSLWESLLPYQSTEVQVGLLFVHLSSSFHVLNQIMQQY